MTFYPEIGPVYPCLVRPFADGKFSLQVFATEAERDAALDRQIDATVKAAFPDLPQWNGDVPTWAKLVSRDRVAVEMQDGEWVESPYAFGHELN